MAINPDLLIAAPMLQDYLVDKDTGLPLSAGVIYLYEDNNRNIFKNWYYQSGSPGAYTYITLDNPLTLSAVGTIQDPNGNDVIPFYYPFSEVDNTTPQAYYIQVFNSNAVQQWVRQNFPFVPPGFPEPSNLPTLQNIITNNVFYHNLGSANVTSNTNLIIAPSQHEGFPYPNGDIRFLKNITGATDTITFTPFGLGNDPLINDITPEYYLNFNCSAAQVGETSKYISFPISLHVKTLENVDASITIQAQNVTGNVNNQLEIFIYQFTGTGALSPSAFFPIETITLNNSWTKYIVNFTFPSAAGLTLGNGGDDAFYLAIQYPLSATCNINFTRPSVYLSESVPTNDFKTYDAINSIISSPRTGDIRSSINSFQPFGWVQLNDGSIGNPVSAATTRANIDTWPLYFMLWNQVGAVYAPMVDSNPYGVSPIADWNANRAIYLTKQLGLAIASVGISSIGSGGTNWALGQTFGEENHTQTIAEMAAHHHAGSSVGVGTGVSTNTVGNNGSGNTGSALLSIDSEGNNTPFNVIQPTVRYNIFMKL